MPNTHRRRRRDSRRRRVGVGGVYWALETHVRDTPAIYTVSATK